MSTKRLPTMRSSDRGWRRIASWIGCALLSASLALVSSIGSADSRAEVVSPDLLIVGGTESGWAAAIQAARSGVASIVLVNDVEWLGGQFTVEAVCAVDENRGVHRKVPFPRAGLFRELMDRIEQFNRDHYGHPRPGNAWTARTTFRPRDGAAVFAEMIRPYEQSGQVTIYQPFVVTRASLTPDGRRLAEVEFEHAQRPNRRIVVRPRLTIDASDWGDIVQASGAAFEYGPDLRSKYSEPSAPASREGFPITDMNPITWCMVIEETDDWHTIAEPPFYDERRYYLTTNVTRREYEQLGWPHRPHRPFNPPWTPDTDVFYQGDRSVYSQRRLLDDEHLQLNNVDGDVILLNWSVQDYPLDVLPDHVIQALEATQRGASKKNIVEMNRRQRQIIFEDAKRHSLGMLYHLQTTVHDRVPDQSHSFRRFRLSDEFGTADRLPPKPYIRESLRLKAMYMMREQDGLNTDGRDQYARVMYHDGIAVWQFVYDFHPTGRHFVPGEEGGTAWEIYIKPNRSWGTLSDRSLFPLRSMIPEQLDGLLGAQKNLGFSSIVSSAVRIHDQSVAIGQAAGAVAAVCLRHEIRPRVIPFDAVLLTEVRRQLCRRREDGVPAMLWPFRDLEPDHESFVAANLMAVSGLLPLTRQEVDFQPDAVAEPSWRRQILDRVRATRQVAHWDDLPNENVTRGRFVEWIWNQIENAPPRKVAVIDPADADGDGIPDRDDALPLDPKNESLPDTPLPPEADGIPNPFPDDVKVVPHSMRMFNFTGEGSDAIEGFVNDTGMPFDDSRGFGWTRDITANNRRRNKVPEAYRDTFLFTRGTDHWQCRVDNGMWRVTVCVGDAGHEQIEQRVTVEDQLIVADLTTAAGEFHEATCQVTVTDGMLDMVLGKEGRKRNTCVNWVRIAQVASE